MYSYPSMRRLSKSCMPIGSFILQSYTFSLILPLFIVKKSYKLTKKRCHAERHYTVFSFFNHESTQIFTNAYRKE